MSRKAAIDPDDICLETNRRHEPDWSSVSVENDGDETYIDVSCADCGRSGCIGTAETLSEGISW